jgi:hypothetical protein
VCGPYGRVGRDWAILYTSAPIPTRSQAPVCNRGPPQAGERSVAASTRRGTRRPGASRKIGMCAVTGQVVSSWSVSAAFRSTSEPSSRMKSGTWQEALTIASNDVRACDTLRPAARSCNARASSVRALVSAMRTWGAFDATGGELAATAGGCLTDVRRCTPGESARNLPARNSSAALDVVEPGAPG